MRGCERAGVGGRGWGRVHHSASVPAFLSPQNAKHSLSKQSLILVSSPLSMRIVSSPFLSCQLLLLFVCVRAEGREWCVGVTACQELEGVVSPGDEGS